MKVIREIFKYPEAQSIALFLVRITLGYIFMAHGAQKVFGVFGGHGLIKFVEWTNSMGVPEVFGYLGAFSEFVGGVLLFFGIAAELGAFMIIPMMLGGIFLVHWNSGFFVQNGGFEYPLNLIFFALAI